MRYVIAVTGASGIAYGLRLLECIEGEKVLVLSDMGKRVLVEETVEKFGRLDILVRGLRRFEIVELSGEKDYLQAEVSFFDDDDPGPAPPSCASRRSRTTGP